MKFMLRRYAAKIAVCSIVIALYMLARSSQISAEQWSAVASSLKFTPTYLEPADNGRVMTTIRNVNSSVRHIDAWISSVGASVALADIAGLGRPADICLVDPRNDSVTVMPAPGTGNGYRPFAIAIPMDGYDPQTIAPMGCLPADVNEDGRMDLILYFWGRTPVVFLRNDQHELSSSAFTAAEIVDEREIWNTNAVILTDIDGDGHPDLVFGNYFRDGDRVLDPTEETDIEMPDSMSRAGNGGRNRILLWQRNGTTAKSVKYRDASDAFTSEMANGWTLALAARDLDDDTFSGTNEAPDNHRLLPELYIANDFGSDRLLRNLSSPGRPRFEIVEGIRDATAPRSKVLGRDSFKGMGVDFGDVVGDGRPAIAVSNISSPYALLESHFLFVHTGDHGAWARGAAPYYDESGPRGTWTSGWAWDIKFADILNSGRPALVQAIGFIKGARSRWPELQELAMGNDQALRHAVAWPRFSRGDELSGRDHDRLFLRGADGTFQDVWPLLGLDVETVSRGIATGDVFGDGRLSVVIARQWSPSLFLRNISQPVGRAIVVDLRVRGEIAGTRAAIGAEARVMLPDGRVATSVIDGGSGHGGKRAPEIHLGLGDVAADQLFPVEFRWRDPQGPHSRTVPLIPGRYRIVLGDHHIAVFRQSIAAERGP